MSGHDFLIFLILLFSYLLLTGCAGTRKLVRENDPLKKLFKVNFTLSQSLEENPPRIIAILPFQNRTRALSAPEVLRRSFYNHLSSHTFRDRELHRVDDLLLEAGIITEKDLLRANSQRLGNILKADALIYGEVICFKRLFLAAYSQVAAGLRVKMISAKDGTILWEASHIYRSHAGGPAITPYGLIPNAIRAGLKMRDVELLRASDNLCREMVETIPNPLLGKIEPAVLQPPQETITMKDMETKEDKKETNATKQLSQSKTTVPELSAAQIQKDLLKAEKSLNAGLLESALKLFRKVLIYQPDNDRAHFETGSIYYRLGIMELAVKEMKKASELKPEHPGYHYNLGLVYSEQGMAEKARREWKKVLFLAPDRKDASVLLKFVTP